ncbi:uncharacterized protein LOC122671595 [Telopea speciosissima]|uniref:uncharacterized protein LOC122671595 n=1 Tax=Telopea speciosissima TaxID=54955 RepID=UPI001CC3BA47|nr:uncharacterized protein LOC122671595 [Telopea speciosissima]XP_043724838.1 uncharacterized protein LOC122671595 [Telopea speciosissima]XP_043724839.1 uncharacterized protein LOC122671595 [Telopea speciosissima]XP_043724840.1 uncharacterized protein LOC122671595 [Telopea speciosissima]
MAAGQQKRRLNAASFVSGYLQEQYRARKRKNLELTQNVTEIDSHIALKLEENQVNPIARREQIGIAWRDLDPFIESAPHRYTPLADVLSLPKEIFELENLTRVLSYEVWEMNLSETEKKFLTQFLPQGMDQEQVLLALLQGENFHFGNPFLKWRTSLCSGNLHPDAVLHQEYCFNANKRAYYLELQKYHDDILEILLNLKETWVSGKDTGKHIVQKTWKKAFLVDSQENSLAVSERTRVITNSKKEEKPHKNHIQSGNGAKYMSYFKISRKQHQLVKRMKQSGDGIQSKSLNRVLGDIKSFHVQPYKTFEEEEGNKLRDYWLVLVNRDLPAAFLDWKERQLKQQQWRCSLKQEMVEKKIKSAEEEEERAYCDSMVARQRENGETENEPSMDMQSSEDDDESVPLSAHYHPLERIPSLNGHHDPMEMHSEEGSQEILKPEGAPPNLSECLGNINRNTSPTEGAVLHEVQVSSSKDVWPVVGNSVLHCHSNSLRQGYPFVSELSLQQPKPMEERATGLIDLESHMVEQDAKEALHMSNSGSFICSYTNEDCNELLQPIFKGQGFLPSYSHEHKQQPMLQFLATNAGAVETGHLPRHFQEQQQLLLLEQREMREKELYMRQIIQKGMYPSGNRYPVPSRELFSPVQEQDWTVDSVHASTPVQSHLAGEGLLGQNWFQDEHRAHGCWSALDVSSSSSRCLGNGSAADESLFSVLSQSNKLQPHSYSQVRLTEQYTPGRDYIGGGIIGNNDVFPQMAPQFNYFSREATATAVRRVNNMPWMNTQHQSAGVHDSIVKSSFLSNWDQ